MPQSWSLDRVAGHVSFDVIATLNELRTFRKFRDSLTSPTKTGGKVRFRNAYWIGAACEIGRLKRQSRAGSGCRGAC